MLRSLINSMKGRSAVAVERDEWLQHVYGLSPEQQAQFEEQQMVEGGSIDAHGMMDVVPEIIQPVPEMPRVTACVATVRPDKCCVYCGNGVYAPRGAGKIRCPKCFNDLPVADLVLKGDIGEETIITAGKITVAEDARVAANLVATTIDVAGRVLGDILASKLCTIRETGKHAGNIISRRLDLKPGAEINGAIELIRD